MIDAGTAATGFLLGLANAAHCAGMCGGIAAVAAAGRGPGALAAWTGAKACGYVFLGTLAGSVGAGASKALAGAATIFAAAATAGMLLAAYRLLRGRPASGRVGAWLSGILRPVFAGAASPAALGLASAFLPCGVTGLALLEAASRGSPAAGLLLLLGFAAGTAPAPAAAALGARALGRAAGGRSLRLAGAALLAAVAVATALRALLPLVTGGGGAACPCSH